MTEPRRHSVGDRVVWFGQQWTITAVNQHPRLGRFFRLESADGGYDLVHENGSDGALEALHPTEAIA